MINYWKYESNEVAMAKESKIRGAMALFILEWEWIHSVLNMRTLHTSFPHPQTQTKTAGRMFLSLCVIQKNRIKLPNKSDKNSIELCIHSPYFLTQSNIYKR